MAKSIFMIVFFTIIILVSLCGLAAGSHYLIKDWLERVRRWDKEDKEKEK